MNPRSDDHPAPLWVVEAPSIEPVASLHPDLAGYFQAIREELWGQVPEEALTFYLNEIAFWIEHKIQDLSRYGGTLDQVVRQVLSSSSMPRGVAEKLIEEHFEDQVDSPLYNRFGRANLIAGALFGIGNVLYLILVQVIVYFPPAPTVERILPFSPATVRTVFPEPLPYPEYTWQFLASVAYPIVAPILLGWIAGRLIPQGSVRAIYSAMFPVLLSAYLLGAILLPNTLGLLYAVFQTLFGLPMGCFTAHLSSSLARRSRLRQVRKSGMQPLSSTKS